MYISRHYFDIAAAFICLTCMIFVMAKRRIRRPRNRIYLFMQANIVLSAVLATLGGYFESSFALYGSGNYRAMYLCYFGYFVIHAALAFLLCSYVFMVNGVAERRTKTFYIALTMPMILTEILVLSTPFSSAVFYFDRNGTFQRGPMEWALYLLSLTYLVAALYSLLRYNEAVTRGVRLTVILFFVVTLAGLLIQFLIKGLKVELFAEALSQMAVLFMIENEDQRIDSVTGLYNRDAFNMENNRLLGTGHEYYVFGINLQNAAAYMHMMGPAETENLLRDISDFLVHLKGADLTFYPLKHIFSIICMSKEGNPTWTEETVKNLEQALLARFEQEWSVGRHHIKLHPIIVEGKIPDEFTGAGGILKLIQAGSDRNIVSTTQLLKGRDLSYLSRRELVAEAVKKALSTDNLQVVYQPIYDATKDRIVTAEALVRLRDPALGYISPEEFIPIAEENGLIVELGRIVFEKVCRFQHENHLEKLGLEYIEVNLSTFQLASEGLAEQLLAILEKYEVPISFINLEITESASASDDPALLRTVRKMQELGFRFSLDDFGTGYSNLSNLLKIEYNNVKIDKSILWSAENRDTARIILEDNIRTIRKLGLSVVQEGVETKAQLDQIVDYGGNLIQGFYFSKPLAREDFVRYLKEFKGKEEV